MNSSMGVSIGSLPSLRRMGSMKSTCAREPGSRLSVGTRSRRRSSSSLRMLSSAIELPAQLNLRALTERVRELDDCGQDGRRRIEVHVHESGGKQSLTWRNPLICRLEAKQLRFRSFDCEGKIGSD